MKNTLRKILPFLIIFLFFILGGGIILILFQKSQIHLFINHYHNNFFDVLFRFLTYAGNGLTPVILSLALLIFSVRKALLMGISTSLAGIVSQIFKNFVFPHAVRPRVFFQDIADLYFVPGVEVHSSHSFPSGHTATAFCMFMILAYLSNKSWQKYLCVLGALLVGYSRMYLSQHFFIDVYFGAILGAISALVVIVLINRAKNDWMDKSITQIILKKK